MTIRQRLIATLTAVVLALGIGVVTASPAQALTGYWMTVSCRPAPGPVTFERSDGYISTMGSCGKAYPVKYVRILPNQCVIVGTRMQQCNRTYFTQRVQIFNNTTVHRTL